MKQIHGHSLVRLLVGHCLAVLLFSFAVEATAELLAHSQSMRLIVPQQAGGGTDLIARQVAINLSASLQQSIVVINSPGAGGTIAIKELLRQRADGQTLMMGAMAMVVLNPLLNPQTSFTHQDLQPVAALVTDSMAIVVKSKSLITDLHELKRQAAQPAGIKLGFIGMGSSGHMIALKLQQTWGGRFLEVPYKDTGAAFRDLSAGELDALVVTTGTASRMSSAGTLATLAISTSHRTPCMKKVGTFKEQGVDLELESWQGLFAPMGTPAATIDRLNFHVNQVLALPEFQEMLAINCLAIKRGASGDFANKIAKEVDFWKVETARLLK